MAGENGIPAPTELIYPAEPSWRPAFLAAGLAAVLAGLFMGWAFIVAGALVALGALLGWIRRTREEFGRLPRRQHLTSAVLPVAPRRRSQPRS
jgi:hypothetical protein